MNRHARRSSQFGFSLLEILITLVIIAVGLMGFAGMMVKSGKNNRIAMHRSLATLYAYDIIDCMRVNRTAATTGAYTLGNFGDVLTGSTVAVNDVNSWQAALSTVLPAGKGKITFAGNTVTVEVQWTETVGAGETGDCSTTPPGPACHIWITESTL
ncbi:MAG TPA: type IV pilus modification protein PilV [Gammaproteobacteria bacterium]|nr:type IV pilus modification protein PilV [Gammaproteobacteria bacterium]HRF44539.1 type IV pilus modification protein PilV [Candidatus Competibacteraceae bacterium]